MVANINVSDMLNLIIDDTGKKHPIVWAFSSFIDNFFFVSYINFFFLNSAIKFIPKQVRASAVHNPTQKRMQKDSPFAVARLTVLNTHIKEQYK